MNDPLLRFDNVSKTFGSPTGGVRAARSVNFTLHSGRALAIVGESGSGKTTCARMAMLEYLPTSGRMLFRGEPTAGRHGRDLAAYRQAVQMIFQDPFASLNPAHTIAYHLKRTLRLHRPDIRSADLDAAVLEQLASVKLDPAIVAPKYPHELSGGQRQRVNIARALSARPQVLVADEPTSMLDVSVRLGVLNLLNEMKTARNLGLLYITHDIATARYVAEDIAVMYSGQIVEWGDCGAVIDNPQHPYTKLLLSAVPDPERRFSDAVSRIDPGAVDAVRRVAAKEQSEVVTVGENHFALAV
ncbi:MULTISPECIES: ABC transporter ATP-binding protein [unclassified Shinella]|uniref:ABC transporter ATP-binding protein n=1 Tax=unclassified Shinella TaxID=2643062 RepID=UPI00234EF331|nr:MULTISPECIES: ABC transporter ATP-binding protein [unclassified Shinella]MCO5153100.1 ATP-binding cassette domain-containing protein [Shinella sp.]MDC7263619.1 ATP-binding cassette domain-containing protein [Shinella sp. HY16]MDC7270514.1 ATP-binding cassette domain-containing protein [Shinella sp. YZ44]